MDTISWCNVLNLLTNKPLPNCEKCETGTYESEAPYEIKNFVYKQENKKYHSKCSNGILLAFEHEH